MSRISVVAGDFLKGEGQLAMNNLVLPSQKAPGGEAIPLSELATVEAATEETARDLVGTIGWGAAGAVILGPVGLLAGLLLGGKKKEITFIARFKDGRKLLATADSATYTRLIAAVF
jgi:hypothetical protein